VGYVELTNLEELIMNHFTELDWPAWNYIETYKTKDGFECDIAAKQGLQATVYSAFKDNSLLFGGSLFSSIDQVKHFLNISSR
jgi:hypothetical protein